MTGSDITIALIVAVGLFFVGIAIGKATASGAKHMLRSDATTILDDALRNASDNHQVELKALRAQRDAVQRELSDTDKALSESDSKRAVLGDELNTLTTDKHDLMELLEQSKSDFAAYKETNAEVLGSNTKLSSKVHLQTETIATQTKRIEELEKQLQDAVVDRNKLKQQVAGHKSTISELEAQQNVPDTADLEKQLSSCVDELTKAGAENGKLQSQIDELLAAEKPVDLSDELKAVEADRANVMKMLDQEIDRSNKLAADLSTAQQQTDDTLKADLGKLQAQYNRINTANGNYQRRLALFTEAQIIANINKFNKAIDDGEYEGQKTKARKIKL